MPFDAYAPSMSVRDMEVIRGLVDGGTTVAAAVRLGISQSAVSRALSLLEDRLGRELFRREGGRLIPTEAAYTAYAEIRDIFGAMSRIENAKESGATLKEPLRIAAPATFAHILLPRIVANFCRVYPDQRVFVDIVSSDVLVTQIAEERANVGILDTHPSHPAVRIETFRESSIMCVMRSDDPLAQKDQIVPGDLLGRELIAQARRHTARAKIDEVLGAAGIEPNIRIEVATAVFAEMLVLEGLGIALVNPFPSLMNIDASLCIRPFVPAITMRMSFVTPAAVPLNPSVMAFMAMVRDAARADSLETI